MTPPGAAGCFTLFTLLSSLAMPFAKIPGAKGARLTVKGALGTPLTLTTTCADVFVPKPEGTIRLICVSLLKSTWLRRPLNVTDRLGPENSAPASVAMDPGTSGTLANVAAFTALWMEGG